MTTVEISQYLGLALAIIALLGHAKGYFSSGEKTLTARTETNEKKLIEHDRRIQTVEADIKHLPDKDTVHKMELAMAEMKSQLASMVKSSEATERATRRVEEFLLNRKGD